jgi:hypothetical protein
MWTMTGPGNGMPPDPASVRARGVVRVAVLGIVASVVFVAEALAHNALIERPVPPAYSEIIRSFAQASPSDAV